MKNINLMKLKAVINKKNNQINICIPKKQASPNLIKKAYSGKVIKLLFEED